MNNKPLNLDIMGREFCVTCPDEEREEIQLAAAYLDRKIQEIKAEGKVIDLSLIHISEPTRPY